jgi:HAD superfamily hydrolase (TIGR01549 family)
LPSQRSNRGNRGVVAVVFDMDGTLFDSATVVPDAYIEAVLACGGSRYERADIIAAYALGPPATILAHLLGRSCDDTDLARYHERLQASAAGVRVYPGLAEALSELAERLPLAVVTGASANAAQILLRAAGLSERFKVVVGGDEVPLPKPDPAGIRFACQRLGVDPRAVGYVGDAAVDVEAARRAGAYALAAGWGHQFSDEYEADRVFREPRDLLTLLGN